MAILVIQHSKLSDAGHLGSALRTHGQKVRTVRVDLGQQLPPDLDDIHGVVSLGGPQSAIVLESLVNKFFANFASKGSEGSSNGGAGAGAGSSEEGK